MILLQNIGHGESWDSQSRTSESQLKKKNKSEIENARGFYETKLLIWRQTPKLCTKVYWNQNIVLLKSTTKAKRNMHHYNNSHNSCHRN